MPEIHYNVIKCFAYLSILIELSKGKELTGYDVIANAKEYGLEISPGTVYHQLRMLSRDGIIIGKSKGKKMTYEMTEEGLKTFKEFKKIWAKPIMYIFTNLQYLGQSKD